MKDFFKYMINSLNPNCSLHFQREHPIIEAGQVRALIRGNNNAEDNNEASEEEEEVQDDMFGNTEHGEAHMQANHTRVASVLVGTEK